MADAFLVEDVGLGKEPHLRGGQPEALGELAGRDEHACTLDFGAADVDRDDAVVAQDLDRPFGAARTSGDENDRLAALARAADVGDPVREAAAEPGDGLRRDVTRP